MPAPANQRKALLTDEVWATLMQQSTLEEKSASAICEHVLWAYLQLPDEQKPSILVRDIMGASTSSTSRTLYISKIVWAMAKGRKVIERRSISAILEQQLRAYMGLTLPDNGV